MNYQVLSPDGLPIAPGTWTSEAAAITARDQWIERYRPQGYYAAVERRIPVDELAAACRIEPVLPANQQPYAGPFPRKRHGHRCLRCGGNPVACYKKHCTIAPVTPTCRWCR